MAPGSTPNPVRVVLKLPLVPLRVSVVKVPLLPAPCQLHTTVHGGCFGSTQFEGDLPKTKKTKGPIIFAGSSDGCPDLFLCYQSSLTPSSLTPCFLCFSNMILDPCCYRGAGLCAGDLTCPWLPDFFLELDQSQAWSDDEIDPAPEFEYD